MKNEIYEYLTKYFDKLTNTEKEIKNVNKFYEFGSNLYKKNKITDGENDILIASISAAIDYTIKIISNCPYLEIHIRKTISNRTKRSTKKKNNVDAIGFQYDEEIYDNQDNQPIDTTISC